MNESKLWWKDGFYDYPIEGGVEITEEYWRELLDGQSAGKVIATDGDGRPVLKDPDPEPPKTEPSESDVSSAILRLMLPQAKEQAKTLDDQQAVECKALYDTWVSRIGTSLEVGERLYYDDRLFKVRTAHTAQENWIPGTDTASLYEEINEVHSGTEDDPIPYNGNMALEQGKYYTQDDVLYKCTRDTGQPVYQSLVELVGIYVELV